MKPKKLRLRLTVGESRDGGTLQIADSEGCVAKRGLFFTILGTCWGLLLGLNAFAQASGPTTIASIGTGGAITGHVRGPGEVAVPGATVELIEAQTGERKETWSDESGNYTLAGVNPGTYKLQVSLVGFRTDIRQPVPVVAGKALQVNVALVMALPEDAAAGQEQRSGRPNLASLPPEVRERLRNIAAANAEGGSAGGDFAGAGGADTVRFSEDGAASGRAQAESSEAAGAGSGAADSSAANSFLLSGSVGRTPSPGAQEDQGRERFQELRRSG